MQPLYRWHTTQLAATATNPNTEPRKTLFLKDMIEDPDLPVWKQAPEFHDNLSKLAMAMQANNYQLYETSTQMHRTYKKYYPEKPLGAWTPYTLYLKIATLNDILTDIPHVRGISDKDVLTLVDPPLKTDNTPDCFGTPYNTWNKHYYGVQRGQENQINYAGARGSSKRSADGDPFAGRGRDPATDWGIMEMYSNTTNPFVIKQSYICCGQALNHPGCWIFDKNTSKPVLYDFAPNFKGDFWPKVIPLTMEEKREFWLQTQQGTAWMDLQYYNGLHAEIQQLKEKIADSMVDYLSVENDAILVEMIDDLRDMLLLEHRYNLPQCPHKKEFPLHQERDQWLHYLKKHVFGERERIRIPGTNYELFNPFSGKPFSDQMAEAIKSLEDYRREVNDPIINDIIISINDCNDAFDVSKEVLERYNKYQDVFNKLKSDQMFNTLIEFRIFQSKLETWSRYSNIKSGFIQSINDYILAKLAGDNPDDPCAKLLEQAEKLEIELNNFELQKYAPILLELDKYYDFDVDEIPDGLYEYYDIDPKYRIIILDGKLYEIVFRQLNFFYKFKNEIPAEFEPFIKISIETWKNAVDKYLKDPKGKEEEFSIDDTDEEESEEKEPKEFTFEQKKEAFITRLRILREKYAESTRFTKRIRKTLERLKEIKEEEWEEFQIEYGNIEDYMLERGKERIKTAKKLEKRAMGPFYKRMLNANTYDEFLALRSERYPIYTVLRTYGADDSDFRDIVWGLSEEELKMLSKLEETEQLNYLQQILLESLDLQRIAPLLDQIKRKENVVEAYGQILKAIERNEIEHDFFGTMLLNLGLVQEEWVNEYAELSNIFQSKKNRENIEECWNAMYEYASLFRKSLFPPEEELNVYKDKLEECKLFQYTAVGRALKCYQMLINKGEWTDEKIEKYNNECAEELEKFIGVNKWLKRDGFNRILNYPTFSFLGTPSIRLVNKNGSFTKFRNEYRKWVGLIPLDDDDIPPDLQSLIIYVQEQIRENRAVKEEPIWNLDIMAFLEELNDKIDAAFTENPDLVEILYEDYLGYLTFMDNDTWNTIHDVIDNLNVKIEEEELIQETEYYRRLFELVEPFNIIIPIDVTKQRYRKIVEALVQKCINNEYNRQQCKVLIAWMKKYGIVVPEELLLDGTEEYLSHTIRLQNILDDMSTYSSLQIIDAISSAYFYAKKNQLPRDFELFEIILNDPSFHEDQVLLAHMLSVTIYLLLNIRKEDPDNEFDNAFKMFFEYFENTYLNRSESAPDAEGEEEENIDIPQEIKDCFEKAFNMYQEFTSSKNYDDVQNAVAEMDDCVLKVYNWVANDDRLKERAKILGTARGFLENNNLVAWYRTQNREAQIPEDLLKVTANEPSKRVRTMPQLRRLLGLFMEFIYQMTSSEDVDNKEFFRIRGQRTPTIYISRYQEILNRFKGIEGQIRIEHQLPLSWAEQDANLTLPEIANRLETIERHPGYQLDEGGYNFEVINDNLHDPLYFTHIIRTLVPPDVRSALTRIRMQHPSAYETREQQTRALHGLSIAAQIVHLVQTNQPVPHELLERCYVESVDK